MEPVMKRAATKILDKPKPNLFQSGIKKPLPGGKPPTTTTNVKSVSNFKKPEQASKFVKKPPALP